MTVFNVFSTYNFKLGEDFLSCFHGNFVNSSMYIFPAVVFYLKLEIANWNITFPMENLLILNLSNINLFEILRLDGLYT